MQAVMYDNDTHLQFICKWLYLRESYIPARNEMPALGVVVYADKMPIAAASLRRVEGNFGQVDGLVSNPEASPEQRHEALDLAISEVIKLAKGLKLNGLIAWTRDESTLLRSTRLGFVPQPHTVLAFDLSEGAKS